VNVHPAKTEVRFRQPSFVHDFVRDTLRHKLLRARPAMGFLRALTTHPDATPSLMPGVSPLPGSPLDEASEAGIGHAGIRDSGIRDHVESEDVESLRDAESFELMAPPREPTAGKLDFSPEAMSPDAVSTAVMAALAAGLPESPEVCGDAAIAPALSAADGANGAGVTLQALGSLKPLGQLRESFILATNEEGLWIIDQHVAHERVLFEKVLRESKTKQVQQQRLLMPMLVELTPAQMVAFAEIAAELERNGFEAEPFGPRTLAVKAAPIGLQGRELERMLTEVLEQHERLEQRENLEALRTRIAASIACHAAVKVNMPLDRTRMEWLLQELGKTEHPTSCPHGRPIALRYSWKDIERAFHRT
jgi:DNA mismatch repair protein MutL